MKKISNYINGKLIQPVKSNYIDIYNPSLGEVYAKCPDSDSEDLKMALKSAKKAFNQWRNSSNEYRRDIILKIADEIEKNSDKFALAETIDNGKPISDSKNIDIPRSVNNLRFYASWMDETLNGSLGRICAALQRQTFQRRAFERFGVVCGGELKYIGNA